MKSGKKEVNRRPVAKQAAVAVLLEAPCTMLLNGSL